MNIATPGTPQVWAQKLLDATSAACYNTSVVYYFKKKKKEVNLPTSHCKGTFIVSIITEIFMCVCMCVCLDFKTNK